MKINNKGYTLLEMIMVLFIVSLIMFVMSFNYFIPQRKLHLKQEARILGSTLQDMQLKSLQTRSASKIIIDNQGFECYIKDQNVCEHMFFKNIQIKTNFKNNTIEITKNGKVSRGGEIDFINQNTEVKLIINISQGRYTIE